MQRDYLNLESILQRRSIDRRRFLKSSVAFGAALPVVSALLAACGGDDDDDDDSGESTATEDAGGSESTSTEASSDETASEETEAETSESSEGSATDEEATEGTDEGSSEPAGEGQPGGVMRVSIIGNPPAFDPTFTTATVTQRTSWHVFESIYYRDKDFAPAPMLLSNAEVSEDGTVFTFHLRDDVLFHNGNPMKSEDMVASLNRFSELSGRGRTLWERVDSVEAPDDMTVVINFNEPTGIAPVYFSMADAIVIPKDIAEASMEGEMSEPIGTGPYMVNEILPDRHISLIRFEDYSPLDVGPDGYGGTKVAYFDEIQFIPVPETAVRADGLVTDQYDFSNSLNTDQFESLDADPNLTLQITIPNYFYGPHFNKSDESMMANKELRQALLAAVDMEPVARAGFGGDQFWRLGPELAAPETAWYTDAGKEFYNQNDPEKAKQMLADAGYDGTAIRWITTKEYAYNYNMALVLKEQLEAVGATIDLQVMDWATLVATRSQRGAWDMFITGHPSYNHPILQVFLNETWPGFWGDPQKDELVTSIIEETDPDTQMGFIEDLQQLFWEDAAMIKVCEGADLRGYRNRLKGYAEMPDWFFWNCWFEE